jgi:hypothetical protein
MTLIRSSTGAHQDRSSARRHMAGPIRQEALKRSNLAQEKCEGSGRLRRISGLNVPNSRNVRYVLLALPHRNVSTVRLR